MWSTWEFSVIFLEISCKSKTVLKFKKLSKKKKVSSQIWPVGHSLWTTPPPANTHTHTLLFILAS